MEKIKPKLLKILPSRPVTASEFKRIAERNGIEVSREYCRDILSRSRMLAMPGKGRKSRGSEIRSFVRTSDRAVTASELAEKFGITIRYAKEVIYKCGQPPTQTSLATLAENMPEEKMTAKAFVDKFGCAPSSAYQALRTSGKLMKQPPKLKSIIQAKPKVISPKSRVERLGNDFVKIKHTVTYKPVEKFDECSVKAELSRFLDYARAK